MALTLMNLTTNVVEIIKHSLGNLESTCNVAKYWNVNKAESQFWLWLSSVKFKCCAMGWNHCRTAGHSTSFVYIFFSFFVFVFFFCFYICLLGNFARLVYASCNSTAQGQGRLVRVAAERERERGEWSKREGSWRPKVRLQLQNKQFMTSTSASTLSQ